MRIGTHCASVLLVVAILLNPATAQTYRGNDPAWEGLWVWAPRNESAPRLEVDLHRWLTARPGGWSSALTYRLVGHAAAAGLSGVDWHLEDALGRRLYPSTDRAAVLRWGNWGADFGAYDYPAAAIEVAARCKLPIRLVARSRAVAEEAQSLYPGTPIVMSDAVDGANTVAAETMEPASLATRWLDRQTQYLRRAFKVDGPVESAQLTVTAQQSYRLYLDGVLVGTDSDWWRGETFDVTEMLTPGRHVLAAKVDPDKDYAGLLLNLRWTTSGGETHELVTDDTWRVSETADEEWAQPGYDDSRWSAAGVYGFEGVGPRFRLKDPWRNPTPVRGGEAKLPTDYVRDIRASASEQGDKVDALVNGVHEEDALWSTSTYPATIELRLPRPTRLREVRVHHGPPNGASQPAVGALKAYRIEVHENGEWVNLVPPVTDAPADRRVAEHAFSPRRVIRLRLVVLAGHRETCGIREIALIQAYDERP